MSFLVRLFKQSKEEDYKTILSTLSRDIRSRQPKLADNRLREHRSTLWSTLYIAAAYVAYVCLWYFRVLTLPRGVSLAPVIVGPLIVLLIRRIVQLWYSRKEAHEDAAASPEEAANKGRGDQEEDKLPLYARSTLQVRYIGIAEHAASFPGASPEIQPRAESVSQSAQ